MAVGLLIIFVLPDFPHTWKLLSPEMRHVANRRMAIDAAEADVDVGGGMSQLQGIKLAFSDPKTYILAIGYHGITGAAGFQNFFPTLTATLGFSHTVSLLLVAPPYIFMVIWSLCHSIASDRAGNRFWFFMYPVPLVIVGALIFMFTNSFGARYFSLFLLIFIFAMNGTIYAWIANAIPRPPAKRAAALAFVNSVGNAASIWTPFTYNNTDAPHYVVAMGVNIGLTALAAVCGIILKFYLEKENRQLARMVCWSKQASHVRFSSFTNFLSQEDADATLTEKDIKKLQLTAELEGIDIAAARQLQKGYRYMI